ncbi:MAG TPA: aminoacyl-tRNA hydrolase, partial [Pyrinomonadaceae bacterium]|nr:aminoacyl-tRNA hydrolase [Pyrinomonadaceae bacterium]
RPKGSHGGHNGLRSIAGCLRTQDFIRLRIGIKPEHPIADTKNFVLQRFAKAEEELLERALSDAENAIEDLIYDGIEKAMSRWNADPAAKAEPEKEV